MQLAGKYARALSSSGSSDIVVLGASVLDMVAYVDRMPAKSETVLGNSFGMSFGGKGANQAVVAAKLGGKVSMITKLGNDPLGGTYVENYQKLGMDMTHVLTTDEASTGAACINVDKNGDNAISVVMAANNLITLQDVENARSTIANAKLLVCQLEVPLDITLAAMRIANEEGTMTFLNTAPAPSSLDPEFIALADIICPNEPETAALTGMPVDSHEQAKAAAYKLLDMGAKNALLTLGSRGAMLVNAEEDGTTVPAENVDAVDTVGAGDCFVGAFSYLYTSGLPMVESMRRACKIASISVTRAGTQSAYPTREEIEKLGYLP
jgi:ribokinase